MQSLYTSNSRKERRAPARRVMLRRQMGSAGGWNGVERIQVGPSKNSEWTGRIKLTHPTPLTSQDVSTFIMGGVRVHAMRSLTPAVGVVVLPSRHILGGTRAVA